MTVTVLTVIAIFCVTTVNAEVVLEDTFNNVTDGSDINAELGASGRQSGTIAPTNYVAGVDATGGIVGTNVIYGSEVNQIGDGGYFSPNANFTGLDENFIVECDMKAPNTTAYIDLIVGSSTRTRSQWTSGHGVTLVNGWFQFYENTTVIAAFENLGIDFVTKKVHIAWVVSSESYGGSDLPRISMFIDDKAVPVWVFNAGGQKYFTRESAVAYAQNYLNFLCYDANATSLWDNVQVRNVDDVTLSKNQWLNDADMGLDSLRTYSHAINLNASGNVTIDGVLFTGTTGYSGGDWVLKNNVGNAWTPGDNNADTQITGAGTNLINGYVDTQWKTASTLELTGLTPGNLGTLELYGICKLAATAPNHRSNFFAVSLGGQYEIDQNDYSEGTGIIHKLEYTVPASGNISIAMTPLTTLDKNEYRWYAFSNWTIPEPGIIGLLALAGMAFLRRK